MYEGFLTSLYRTIDEHTILNKLLFLNIAIVKLDKNHTNMLGSFEYSDFQSPAK